MKTILQCLLAPRLYRMHRPLEMPYQPNALEKWGDKVIYISSSILNVGIYTSPIICMYMYKRGYFSTESSLTQFIGGIGCIILLSFIIRGVGRSTNPVYQEFLLTLGKAKENPTPAFMQSLRKYDFDFGEWPVNYAVPRKPISSFSWIKNPYSMCANADLPAYKRIVIQTLAFAAIHTFGLRLIYPGTLSLIQSFLSPALLQGRAQLVEEFSGVRSKVETTDGNQIDTMFVDNRRGHSLKGNTLIICCEGNSGFYEIGIMLTPVKVGYSALGWNHPGFAGSTGVPFPDQEQNAIDAVMLYAINELGFTPDDIVMFGWSIGGYAAAWAAVNYQVKGLVLDATFDDLLPLAENQMPKSWSLLVKEVVRTYVDLNVAELVARYDGPVQLIRRTEDEIICLQQGHLKTNRGNELLIRLIESRHHDGARPSLLSKYVELVDSQRVSLERSEISESDKKNLQLISRYLKDYKSTHCTPLPKQVFESVMINIVDRSHED